MKVGNDVIILFSLFIVLCHHGASTASPIRHSKKLRSFDSFLQMTKRNQETKFKLLQRVLTAIHRAIAFFNEDYSAINVDGLFGIRLCQGSIVASIHVCESKSYECPEQMLGRLATFNESLERAGKKAMPYIELEDPEYYRRFIHTIDSPYVISYIPETFNNKIDDVKVGTEKIYDEDAGDRCFALLMGTYKDADGMFSPKCSVTKECWDLMNRDNMQGYVLTHALLYFVVADKNGCIPQIEKYAASELGERVSVRTIERRYCKSIYKEALEQEVQYNRVPVIKQDLFLEQNVICGQLGFTDFFRQDWIEMVLSWQSRDGCFAMPQSLVKVEEELTRIKEDERTMMRRLMKEAEDIDKSSWTGRKLMREHVMNDHCLAHKTGLGFGALGVYLRYLIEQVYAK